MKNNTVTDRIRLLQKGLALLLVLIFIVGILPVAAFTAAAEGTNGEPPAEPDSYSEGTNDPDAGDPDAGDPDAGDPDAGDPDAGDPDADDPDADDSEEEDPEEGEEEEEEKRPIDIYLPPQV